MALVFTTVSTYNTNSTTSWYELLKSSSPTPAVQLRGLPCLDTSGHWIIDMCPPPSCRCKMLFWSPLESWVYDWCFKPGIYIYITIYDLCMAPQCPERHNTVQQRKKITDCFVQVGAFITPHSVILYQLELATDINSDPPYSTSWG